MQKITLFFLCILLSTLPNHATRDIDHYLADVRYPKKMMVIEEGKNEIQYDQSIYTVNTFAEVNPDLLDDLRTQNVLSQIPASTFDTIVLNNIPLTTFNPVSSQNFEPISIFQQLQRLLKPGGTLEFNNMWQWTHVSNQKTKSTILNHLVIPGKINPFEQYLTAEDHRSMEGRKLDETSQWEDYKSQLAQFFQVAGFSMVRLNNDSDIPEPPVPWSARTYTTPYVWWVITK